MKSAIFKSGLSLLAFGLATPVVAHDDFDTETITVIGSALDIDQSNASVSVVDAAAIERAQNGAVSELLTRLPGINISQNGSLGNFTGVRIRGAEAEQTQVVIDGVRVGDPSSPGGGFDFGSLMLGNIDRIEVLRGANSLPWGSQAIGGVVAITVTSPNVSEDKATGQIGAEYGARDTLRLNARLRGAAIGPARFGFGGSYVRTDGISNAAIGTERDGYRQYSLSMTNRTAIGGTVTLGAFGLLTDSRVDLDGFGPPSFSFGDTAEYQDTAEHYAAATVEHRPGGNDSTSGFSHKLQFGFADINRDNFNPAFGAVPTFSARGRNERLSYNIDWSSDVTESGRALRLLASVEREWARSLTDDGFAPDSGKTATTSAWGMLVGKPTATLSLTAGIRHDDHRDFGGATSVAFDAGQEIGKLATFRASYREGFKAPTLFQLSGSAGAFGNPALLPEKAKAYEVAMRLSDKKRWYVDIALFRRDSVNLIDFISCPQGPNPLPAICATGNRPFGTYDNINRARAEGVELDGSVKLSDAMQLDGNYSLLSVKDRTPGSPLAGNRLARRPRHRANAELVWTPGGVLTGSDVSVAVRYAGDSFDDRANNVRLDSYWLIDLRASHALTGGIDLFGRIENLFDAEYQTVATYGTAGRSVYIGARWGF